MAVLPPHPGKMCVCAPILQGDNELGPTVPVGQAGRGLRWRQTSCSQDQPAPWLPQPLVHSGVSSLGVLWQPLSFQGCSCYLGCPYSFPLTFSNSTYPPCPFSWMESQKGLQKPCQKVMRLCFAFIRRPFQEACPVLPLPPLHQAWLAHSLRSQGWVVEVL